MFCFSLETCEDERLHLVGCRTYMFARPVPLKRNPKASRGVEAPRGPVAPADVAIVRRCSISFHDGFRRKAHTSRTVVAFRALFTKANAVLAISPNRSGAPLTRVLPPLLSSQNHCYEKRCVSRGSTRASLFFCFRDNPKRPKGTGPSHQAAARGFHSATRRSSARRAKRAYTGPSGKGDLLSSFRCGDAWKRRGDLSFRFLLFFSARPGKTQARVVRGGTARRSLL